MKVTKIVLCALMLSLLVPSTTVSISASDSLDTVETVVYQMNWTDEDGNLLNEDGSLMEIVPYMTFWGNCGSAVLVASGSLVTAIIRPDGWVAWAFAGNIADTRFDSRSFALTNFDNTYVYNLSKRHGQRLLTLTGKTTDITGKTCSVIPGAQINHYW